MVTSETLTIFRKLTCGSYEKTDDTSVRPTNASVAMATPSRRIVGLTKTARISHNNRAKDHAICVAAIETGADRASKNNETLKPNSIFLVMADEFDIRYGQSALKTIG
jgi:hypothetical protein